MREFFNIINQNKPKLREFDPSTMQRIKEGSYLVKLISETEVTARKCNYYSGIASDQEIANFFKEQAHKLSKAKRVLQDYYESMTKE
ncbi:hypothetical protein [Desulfitibacter alkalitolerans]|uniref:hypothetical protein n=1 Tax=Desulfitibacter alkalitolerans TaxID=264641 RepID=UPI000551FBA3|nr:hypothetical protein [Desulfitibacter alkalitolerans]